MTGPRGRSDQGALEKSGKIESSTRVFTSTKNIKNHCLALEKQPQPTWIPTGLSRSQKRRIQRLRAIDQKENKAEDVENKTCNNLEPRTAPKQMWRPKEVKVKRPVISQSSDNSNLMKKESLVIRVKSFSHDAMGINLAFKIVQSRKTILLGGQDVITLMRESREDERRWIQHLIFEPPFVGC